MDGLLDLFFALLALAGKYWFVVLGYVIYRMLGLDKKKSAKEAKRSQLPPLTPTTSGGENRRVTVGQRPAASQQQDAQPMPDETGETLENRDYEWKPIPKATLTHVEQGESATPPGILVPIYQDAAPIETHVPVEPQHAVAKEKLREGMKWAIIFSEPRSRSPYRPMRGIHKSK